MRLGPVTSTTCVKSFFSGIFVVLLLFSDAHFRANNKTEGYDKHEQETMASLVGGRCQGDASRLSTQRH